jgi:hypothetical protein
MVSFLAVGLKETSKIEMFCKVISIFQRNQDGDADSLSALCSKKQAQRHEKALGISLAPSNDGAQPMPNSNCWRG